MVGKRRRQHQHGPDPEQDRLNHHEDKRGDAESGAHGQSPIHQNGTEHRKVLWFFNKNII